MKNIYVTIGAVLLLAMLVMPVSAEWYGNQWFGTEEEHQAYLDGAREVCNPKDDICSKYKDMNPAHNIVNTSTYCYVDVMFRCGGGACADRSVYIQNLAAAKDMAPFDATYHPDRTEVTVPVVNETSGEVVDHVQNEGYLKLEAMPNGRLATPEILPAGEFRWFVRDGNMGQPETGTFTCGGGDTYTITPLGHAVGTIRDVLPPAPEPSCLPAEVSVTNIQKWGPVYLFVLTVEGQNDGQITSQQVTVTDSQGHVLFNAPVVVAGDASYQFPVFVSSSHKTHNPLQVQSGEPHCHEICTGKHCGGTP